MTGEVSVRGGGLKSFYSSIRGKGLEMLISERQTDGE